jgi:dsDNA-specific endonuclease/ATPase MutS2
LRGSKRAATSSDREVRRPDAGEQGPIDITGSDTIDLHTFQPKEIRSVVRSFVDASVEAGWEQVRIIHGKGTGIQRKIVQSVLEHHPSVISYRTAPDASGWGATVVRLRSSGSEQGKTDDGR